MNDEEAKVAGLILAASVVAITSCPKDGAKAVTKFLEQLMNANLRIVSK